MYDIEFTKSSKRQFDKLPLEVQERISVVLDRVRIRPKAYFERLVGEKAYKLRIGKFRVLADIYQDKLLILVVKVSHRKNIYKK